MKILIIGGTYFLGKAFADMAEAGNELYFINRGTMFDRQTEDVKKNTFVMDRHDKEALKQIRLGRFDVVVDFCAYQEGDIRTVVENLGSSIGQYIFISTTDVYRRGTGKDTLFEEDEFETRDFGGDAGNYILGKVALEREVRDLMKKKNESGKLDEPVADRVTDMSDEGVEEKITPHSQDIRYTVLRPVFIYGPGNYAPREGMYFKWIKGAGQILSPAGSDGFFQMIYVKDAARQILLCCNNEKAFDRAFNLCSNDKVTYEIFEDALYKAADKVYGNGFAKIPVDLATIDERGIPLPFPLRKAESEFYSGERIKELGAGFVSLEEGLAETAGQYEG
ncbi:Nucleoside-diphosphate-sugar epimerase [Eubacterium ruminantium]|nr:Nucleoside-diphosphate-sugar epimerase [Eubacterium ruminantium]